MFDRLLKKTGVLTKPRFWIWHGCTRKGYAEFRICLIMASYASIMPKYALICLNMAECCWMSFPCSDYVRVLNTEAVVQRRSVKKMFLEFEFCEISKNTFLHRTHLMAASLNMLQYSYNNITIILTNSCLLDLYIQALSSHFIFF